MAELKVAVVTGAGSGIGRAASLALVGGGFVVVASGRKEAALLETAQRAGAHAARIVPVVADVTSEDSVRALFAHVKERFGRLDVLFNNAGISTPGAIEDLSLADWQRVVETNLTGVFLCTREAFRLMKEQRPQGGRIINNGSISAHAPRPDSAPYTATKHAISGLTKSTSLDGRKYDIACGQLDIGNAETALASRFHAGVMQAHGAIAPEPVMDVELVGKAVLHMAELPLEANIQSMTIMATKMPFIGRG